MSSKSEHLARIKLELAEKYERLANGTKSKPRKKQFKSRAGRYRRQAADLVKN